ncbi:MAG: nucleoside-triphosphatase [Thermodesulfobacteriota bacterium]|nr:nucleoside-triphosphatase [Thermodesulfobacteriota bacterium]
MVADRQHKWAQAAVAASVWSASEVVLGFLLHSYKVPFKGQILTGIAIVILTALHKEWGGRGIIIRAALICALLKLLAPTPKIIGPVIAILVEGTLLELAICLFGRNPIAYLIGGGMAMTWTFVQKIGKLLFFYGEGMIELYGEILDTFSTWVGFHLSPAVFLLFCSAGYFLLGSLFGIIGMRISVKSIETVSSPVAAVNSKNNALEKVEKEKYSPVLIAVHFLFLITILILSDLTVSIYASMAVYLCACIFLYQKRLGKTKNIRIWIPVFLVMILSGLFLHKGGGFFSVAGFYSGLAMGFRALFITFSVHFLIIELTNPKIKGLLIKEEKGNLFAALGMAQDFFQTVETSIEAKDFLKHPLKSIRHLIGIGLGLEQKPDRTSLPQVIIVTGGVDSGKTTLLQQFLCRLEERCLKVGGVVAEGVWKNGEKCGYDALFLASGERRLLCRKGFSSPLNIGRFGFYEEVFSVGRQTITTEKDSVLTVLDEIGRLELTGKGWATALSELLAAKNRLLIVVRRDFIEKVAEQFTLTNYAVVDAETEGSLEKLVSYVDR